MYVRILSVVNVDMCCKDEIDLSFLLLDNLGQLDSLRIFSIIMCPKSKTDYRPQEKIQR